MALKPSRFLFRAALAWLVAVCATALADGQDWPKLLFKTTSHDFGTIARGAVAEFRFQMENPYNEDVHIAKVESTCGCTKPTVTKQLLKTYETGEIVATLDTRRFLGQKDAKIQVHFDQPTPAVFTLRVSSYIRSDVVFEPGEVQFGSVFQGQEVKKQVSVSYAGRPTWKIVAAGTDSPYLGLAIAETGRTVDPQTKVGKVSYELWVSLKKDTTPGYFKDLVFLQTDDTNQQTARIPITVEALVVPSLSVNPAVVMFDAVGAGQTVSKNVVLSGQKPFRIVKVEGPDPRFHFSVSKEAKPYQVVLVEFQAGDRPGKIAGKIRITTDLPGARPMEVTVDGLVQGKDGLQSIPRPAPRAAGP